jgi:membrane protein DedA with SNARE-associated domain
MIKRNLISIILISIGFMSLRNIDFSNISESKEYWSLILASILILGSILLIYKIEAKNKKDKNTKS